MTTLTHQTPLPQDTYTRNRPSNQPHHGIPDAEPNHQTNHHTGTIPMHSKPNPPNHHHDKSDTITKSSLNQIDTNPPNPDNSQPTRSHPKDPHPTTHLSPINNLQWRFETYTQPAGRTHPTQPPRTSTSQPPAYPPTAPGSPITTCQRLRTGRNPRNHPTTHLQPRPTTHQSLPNYGHLDQLNIATTSTLNTHTTTPQTPTQHP